MKKDDQEITLLESDITSNKDLKKNIPVQYIDQKRIVDINKLLNRVKIDQKNETK
ncbi:MAG: hypothetical protein HN487_02810, partial [Flavobacterium sp.]|nr:hypothetical protein [Flavobacterium sp.]